MNDKTPKSMWGPWSTDLRDPAERMAQLPQPATLVHVLVGMRTRDYSDSVKHLEHALRVVNLPSGFTASMSFSTVDRSPMPARCSMRCRRVARATSIATFACAA